MSNVNSLDCYLNGEYTSTTNAKISIADLGFIHGVTVTEQLRTIGGQPFLLSEHLTRFQSGLDLLNIRLPDEVDLTEIVSNISSNFLKNSALSDCAIGIFCTPGTSTRYGHPAVNQPTLCVYSYALPSDQNQLYEDGLKLTFSSIQDTDKASWPKHVKIRSRLHYFLADQDAPEDSLALLCDRKGFVRDTSIASLFFVFNEKEITVAPFEEILSSISLGFLLTLAEELGWAVVRREVHRSEVGRAKAIGLVNSLFCICSARSIDGTRLDMNSKEVSELTKLWELKTGARLQANRDQEQTLKPG